MVIKTSKGQDRNKSTGSSTKIKTAGQTEKDIIPMKDKNPDDLEIVE